MTSITGAAAAVRVAPPRGAVARGRDGAWLAVGPVGAELRARSCAALPCDAAGGEALAVPPPFAAGARDATAEALTLAGGRAAVLARVRDAAGRSWLAVVLAPTRAGSTPSVVFSGHADLLGEASTGAPAVVQLVPSSGHVEVVVGATNPTIDLCGRPALLSPRVLDPATGELRPAKLQRLSEVDRRGARRLVATRAEAGSRRPLARLLVATGASSAIGAPTALTDGDLSTSWAEGRGGDGRGEFVTTRAPRDVPVAALRFVVSSSAPEARVASPRRMFLATDGPVFEVVLPEDGALQPGHAYVISLDPPIQTSCVAVALEDAYPSRDVARTDVTLAELEAESEVERGRGATDLVELLRAGDEQARAAAGVLMRAGPEARRLVADRYDALPFAGRMLALGVADQSPCAESAPLYVRALASRDEPELRHARARLERCRKGAVPALVAATVDAAHPSQVRAADELGLISPADAADAIGRAIAAGGRPARERLGGLMARALTSPRADAAAARLIADPTPPLDERLRLLALASPRLGSPEVAAAARSLLQLADASFDSRYLALPSRAALAAAGDEGALESMSRALRAPEAAIRARAVALSASVARLASAAAGSARDPEPRVRRAAAGAAARAWDVASLSALFADEWTFVRTSAYDAAARAPALPVGSALLARATEERSPLGQAALLDALAERGAAEARPVVRAMLLDTRRAPSVRARAARAASILCDQTATDALVELLRAGAQPTAKDADRVIAGAALVALGRLHPADLAARLAFLRGAGTPAPLALAARSALDDKDVCPR
ncbi:MAG: hypothetical protein IT374_02985 [Polyangiaceae bacterium]|nr:hypothetical protein [Polyangiaceae bacterium]